MMHYLVHEIIQSFCYRHEKVVDGITVCSEFRGHERFLPIIQGVYMSDSQMKVCCVMCMLFMLIAISYEEHCYILRFCVLCKI